MVEPSAVPSPTYLRIHWHHEDPDDPVILYSELDVDRREIRKVEVYADGRMDFADEERSTGSTWLGEGTTPPVEEINAYGPFEAVAIFRDEFEQAWSTAVARHAPA